MAEGGQLYALWWGFGSFSHPWRKQRHQEARGETKAEKMTRVRPAFRVELKVRVRRADGTMATTWMAMPRPFDGQSVECALEHAVDKASDEVRRIAKRPEYDLVGVLGAEYHVINVRFVRTDVEDEDGEI